MKKTQWINATDRTPQHYVRLPLKVLIEDDWQYHIGWWDFSKKGFCIYSSTTPILVDRVKWLEDND